MSVFCQDVLALTPGDLTRIAQSFTQLHKHDAETMEEMGELLIDHLYNMLRPSPEAPPQCALIRLFKTCGIEELPADLREKVCGAEDNSFRTLALIASRGEHPDWNSRTTSRGHQAIPLESVEGVENIPMIANLIRMLGLSLNDIVSPNPELNIAGFYPLSVFYVDEAADSPYIPAKKDFVMPYNIHTVVGFGGLLTFSDMFTIIMFFKVPIPKDVAALFKDLAQEVHQLLLPFENSGRIFKA